MSAATQSMLIDSVNMLQVNQTLQQQGILNRCNRLAEDQRK